MVRDRARSRSRESRAPSRPRKVVARCRVRQTSQVKRHAGQPQASAFPPPRSAARRRRADRPHLDLSAHERGACVAFDAPSRRCAAPRRVDDEGQIGAAGRAGQRGAVPNRTAKSLRNAVPKTAASAPVAARTASGRPLPFLRVAITCSRYHRTHDVVIFVPERKVGAHSGRDAPISASCPITFAGAWVAAMTACANEISAYDM